MWEKIILISRYCFYIICTVYLSSCQNNSNHFSKLQIQSIDEHLLPSLPKQALSFQQDIKPILAKRCVICHACNDAPCQIKLSSENGLLRGGNKEPVYASRRLLPMRPSRLDIDANTTKEWRDRDFYSVLNENHSEQEKLSFQTQDPHKQKTQANENLQQSLLYQAIKQKQLVPQAKSGQLGSQFKLAIKHQWSCPDEQHYLDFLKQNSHAGMPYALPNLSDNEYTKLVHWIAQGSPFDSSKELSLNQLNQIQQWERFLNQDSLKQQLVSRYIYEHLSLGHLYFSTDNSLNKNVKKNNPKQFYRLVRSYASPVNSSLKSSTTKKTRLSISKELFNIKEIATRRPYESPYSISDSTSDSTIDLTTNKKKFYYRIKPYDAQIVLKTHRPYLLSAEKMEHFKQLFLQDNYQVATVPSYEAKIASNPFATFAQIPAKIRYQFLLDNAYFFINGFIKGPVCRGQVALNVINDHFWMVFYDPKHPNALIDDKFLHEQQSNLQLPANKRNTLKIHSIVTNYWQQQKDYLNHKHEFINTLPEIDIDKAIEQIWYGQSITDKSNISTSNPSAALTIFRHTDSASLSYGFIGSEHNSQRPKTTMVMDYPLFERIHYLLVAGFDVFGNIGHQVNTRLYMDFLRMEGEDNFLRFLPTKHRLAIQQDWNQGIRQRSGKIFNSPKAWLTKTYASGNFGQDSKQTVYQKLIQYFQQHSVPLSPSYSFLNKNQEVKLTSSIQLFMHKINQFKGENLKFIPDISFIRIKENESKKDQAFTLIHHKAYYHLSSLLQEDKDITLLFDSDLEKKQLKQSRDYQQDSLVLVPWLEGDYPDIFIEVEVEQLEQFTQQFLAIKSKKTYEAFVKQYGIRRTNPNFWASLDWFTQKRQEQEPISAGIYDLNRYENR